MENKQNQIHKTYSKPLCLIILCFLMINLIGISLVSASDWFDFDNYKLFDENVGDYGKVTIMDKSLFGEDTTLRSLELKENTDYCSSCSANLSIIMYEDGILIEDIKFDYIKGESRIDYKIEYMVNNQWIEYNYEKVKGNSSGISYNVKIKGEIQPFQIVDWKIKSQSFWINEWIEWTSELEVNLESYFDFKNETATTRNVPNLINGSNNGTIQTIAVNWTSGLINNAIRLNATTNQRINMSNGTHFGKQYAFSISIWYKNHSSMASSPHLFTTTPDSILIRPRTSDIAIFIGGKTLLTNTSSSFIPNWNHIILTLNETSNLTKIYFNGNLSNVSANALNNATLQAISGIVLGDNLVLGTGGINAEIDEFAVWSRPLTQAEVTQLYNGGNGITYRGVGISVNLNSPIDNFISPTIDVEFNCSALVIGGATLQNISLWHNGTGTFELNQTISFTSGYELVGDGFDIASAGIGNSLGMTSDGSDFWLCDLGSNFMFHFNSLGDNQTDGFDMTSAGVGACRGVTTNGSDFWVIDNSNGFVYHFNSSGDNQTDGFDVSVDISDGEGIYYNGSDWWIIDATGSGEIVQYNSSFDAINSFATSPETFPAGIDGSDSQLWVFGYDNKDLIPYSFDGVQNLADKFNISQFGITSVNGQNGLYVSSDETEFWILDTFDDFMYHIRSIGTSTTQTFTSPMAEATSTLWSCGACDINSNCSLAEENRTVNVDTIAPSFLVESPNGTITYGLLGGNETLNVTFIDNNLGSCSYNYNGTNVSIEGCLSGRYNNTNFTLESGNFNITLYANDSLGNFNSTFISWDYKVFQINQTFNNLTFSSAEEIFTLDFLFGSGLSISSAFMQYNNTNYTSTIISLGDSRRLSNTINVPNVNEDTNFTFNFVIDIGSELISTISSKQLVSPINMTNCSGGGTVILNMSLFDERLKTKLDGDIEINAQALDKNSLNNAGFSNLIYNDVASGSVCVGLTGVLDNLYLDAEIKYSSDNYEPELYYIQRADLSNYPINLSLFDLLTNESTEFLITYQDDDLILVSEAIIQLQRKYISEDLYEVVEAPLTSDSGTAVIHVDLDTNIYRATIVKDGEVLDFFDNIVFHCESELSGLCTQELLGIIDPQNDVSIESLTDFSYLISQVNDTFTTAFSIPSGVPQTVNVLLTQIDQFNNTFLCNQTVFSSAGAVDCVITPTIGDSFLDLKIRKENLLQAEKSYLVQEDASLHFLGNNYFILFILMLSIIGMAFTSPEWIVINGVITMVIAGGLYLANGVDFVVGLGNLIWLIITAVILIYKMAHQEDR